MRNAVTGKYMHTYFKKYIPELATRTKNFTGAELEGLVKATASYAFSRCVDVNDLSKVQEHRSKRLHVRGRTCVQNYVCTAI
jgi:hypothetical protein